VNVMDDKIELFTKLLKAGIISVGLPAESASTRIDYSADGKLQMVLLEINGVATVASTLHDETFWYLWYTDSLTTFACHNNIRQAAHHMLMETMSVQALRGELFLLQTLQPVLPPGEGGLSSDLSQKIDLPDAIRKRILIGTSTTNTASEAEV